jgi:hypothetical protein
VFLTILLAGSSCAIAQTIDHAPNSVAVCAAKLTSNNFEDFLTPTDIRFRDTYLAGGGYSRRLTTFFDRLNIEALGQTAFHFGQRIIGSSTQLVYCSPMSVAIPISKFPPMR